MVITRADGYEQNGTEKGPEGLSGTEARSALAKFGPNVITPPKISFWTKLVHWLLSPISLLLVAAALLSFYTGKTFDGWFILALFIVNFLIARWHEAKADKAIATLQKKLTMNVQTRRDGQWQLVPSEQLVPGDAVQLGVGSVVPADVLIVECKNLSINESVLTGESLPKDKTSGVAAYTGSFITTGSLSGTVTATGDRTKFGKTVTLVDTKPKDSVLEHDIVTISKYLMVLSLGAVLIITVYLLAAHQSFSDLLRLDLSLLIAGVPVAMPTVMSLIISLGVLQLTRKHVVVRRLSSLEDLANVDLLLSDKTGTLTQNEIRVEDVTIYEADEPAVLRWAVSATSDNRLDPINQAVITRARQAKVPSYKQLDFTPADSARKRSTAVVEVDGRRRVISLGAPQIIETLCKLGKAEKAKFAADVEKAAEGGYRSLALAVGNGDDEKNLKLTGLLLLSDTLRPDAGRVIEFLNKNGIGVKMMTGDNRSIAARVATALGLKGKVVPAAGRTSNLNIDDINQASVFAEVLPDDKFRIVKAAAAHYTVAATGDGVNDLPALKTASVGIAVSNAVDALKSAADIVLLTSGIGVIRDAIIEARKIFMRTYYYSVYRISESSRLIISILILSIMYGSFPLMPIQIILLALLNDLPIITLAYDRVKPSAKPAVIHARQRFELASLFGVAGVVASITLFLLMRSVLHLPTGVIQTMFFLNLAVSGHMLIYLAHTKERWWRWLPSKEVIWATTLTQLAASIVAFSGLLFARINLNQILLVWLWAFGWMQITELAKQIFLKHSTTL